MIERGYAGSDVPGATARFLNAAVIRPEAWRAGSIRQRAGASSRQANAVGLSNSCAAIGWPQQSEGMDGRGRGIGLARTGPEIRFIGHRIGNLSIELQPTAPSRHTCLPDGRHPGARHGRINCFPHPAYLLVTRFPNPSWDLRPDRFPSSAFSRSASRKRPAPDTWGRRALRVSKTGRSALSGVTERPSWVTLVPRHPTASLSVHRSGRIAMNSGRARRHCGGASYPTQCFVALMTSRAPS